MANYLYNGVELPPLPEWDRKKYPYVVLWEVPAFNLYVVSISNVPVVFDSDTGYCTHIGGGKSVDANKYAADTSWRDFEKELDTSDDESLVVFWTNTDILKTGDGTLYLAASKAINAETGEEIDYSPIVSVPTLDPTSLLQGCLGVGW